VPFRDVTLSAILAKCSVTLTKASVVPTKHSVIPTKGSVIPTKGSVIPTAVEGSHPVGTGLERRHTQGDPSVHCVLSG